MKETNSHPGSTAGFDHQPGVFPFADYARPSFLASLPFYFIPSVISRTLREFLNDWMGIGYRRPTSE